MTQTARKNIIRFLVLLLVIATAVFGVIWLAPELEKLNYTLKYTEEIEENAKLYGVDPYLAAAVIHCESSFNPDAVSRKGAVGLMQIMPDTGEWIAQKLQDTAYTESSLALAQRNIRYGCWYLGYLSKMFDGDITLTLCAYNAGPGTVNKWLNDPKLAQNEVLTSIPYPETENYVQKVQHAYEKYQDLYPNIW